VCIGATEGADIQSACVSGGNEGTDIQGACVSGTKGTNIQGTCVSGGLKVRIYRVRVYRGD